MTDTLTRPSEAAERGKADTREEREPSRARRTSVWIAVFLAAIAVVVLALTAFTDDDADVPTQGFHPEAVAHERDAHLEGQARTHAGAPSTESSGDEVLPGSRRVPSS